MGADPARAKSPIIRSHFARALRPFQRRDTLTHARTTFVGDLRFVVLEMSGGCEKENIDYILGVVNEHSRASTMVDDKSASNQHKKLVDITWRVQQRRWERLLSEASTTTMLRCKFI